MTVPFIYTSFEKSLGVIEIDDERSHHLRRVLRVKPGDFVEICDGEGSRKLCLAEGTEKGKVILQEHASFLYKQNLPKISIFQAVFNRSSFENAVRLAAYAGAYSIIPFYSHRSSSSCGMQTNIDRLRKIAESACSTARRSYLMKISDEVKFSDVARSVKEFDLSMIASSPDAPGILKRLRKGKPESIALVIGPEGGLEDNERIILSDAGFVEISLGNLTLPSECAGAFGCYAINRLMLDEGSRNHE